MAWTPPDNHVWTAGEVLTASNMNTYIRLNLDYLYGLTTLLSSGYNETAAVNAAATGTYDVITFALGLATRPSTVVINGVVWFGYGSGWVNATVDCVPYYNSTPVSVSPGITQAVASTYMPLPVSVRWPVANGQDMGFKLRVTIVQVQTNAGWYAGRANYEVFG
jgi:hypothetical protein